MATKDSDIELHRPLAKFLWPMMVQYKTNGAMTENVYWYWYDQGNHQLSSLFENLVVAVRNAHGKPTIKTSVSYQDFDNTADHKYSTVQHNGVYFRIFVRSTKKKIGTIYVTAYNKISDKIHHFAIPYSEHRGNLTNISIVVDTTTGEVTSKKYKKYEYASFEEAVLVD